MSPGLSPSHVATGDPIMGKGNEDPMPGIAIWGEQILGTWEGGVNHNEQNQGLNPELPSPRPPRYSGKQPWQGSSYTLLAQFPPALTLDFLSTAVSSTWTSPAFDMPPAAPASSEPVTLHIHSNQPAQLRAKPGNFSFRC